MREIVKEKLALNEAKKDLRTETARLRALNTIAELRNKDRETDDEGLGDLIRRMSAFTIERGSFKSIVHRYGLTYKEGAVLYMLRTNIGIENPSPVQHAANKLVIEYLFGSGTKGEEESRKASAGASQVAIFADRIGEKRDPKPVPFLKGELVNESDKSSGRQAVGITGAEEPRS